MTRPPATARSTLFVPGSRPDMIVKAAASQADAVCLDLEDSVAPAEKVAGRGHVIGALRDLDFGTRLRMVRINALDTPLAYRDIVEVVEGGAGRVDALMVPKVASARDLWFVDTLLSQIEAHLGLATPVEVHAQIESAAKAKGETYPPTTS